MTGATSSCAPMRPNVNVGQPTHHQERSALVALIFGLGTEDVGPGSIGPTLLPADSRLDNLPTAMPETTKRWNSHD